MPASFPSPGDSIGRFRVLAQLGAGGMGVVYDALEVNLERRVALKVISPLFADDPDFRRRFISEARALASLDSPHVVQVYAHGEEDGYLYIATQLVPDGDLGQMITTWGPAPLGKAVELIEQVASGLADAHAAGLVHRDIKPANVLVRRRGTGPAGTVHAYLGDFGIARRVDAEATQVGGSASPASPASMVVGTPSYMAPELHGGARAGVGTDVYSLGCLLWVVLTGQPPYVGTSGFEIVGAHISKPVPQLDDASPLAVAVNRILRVAMAEEPGHRYRAALTLRGDLREAAAMTGDPNHARFASDLVAAPLGRATPGPAQQVQRPQPLRPLVPVAVPPPPLPPPSPATRPPSGSRTGLWVGLAAAAVAVVVGGTAALVAGSGAGGGGDGVRTAAEQEFLDTDAEAILLEAEKDMRVLDSVRLDGSVVQDGQETAIAMVVTSIGDCDGEFRIGEGVAQLRRVDGESWLRPDRAFLEATDTGGTLDVDAFVALIGDNWVKADPAQSEDFADLCDLDELLEGDETGDPTVSKGEVSEIDGTEVVTITEQGEAGTTTAYVRLEAPHYLLRLENEADEGSYRLSAFDEEFAAEPPPSDEVVDPAAFE